MTHLTMKIITPLWPLLGLGVSKKAESLKIALANPISGEYLYK